MTTDYFHKSLAPRRTSKHWIQWRNQRSGFILKCRMAGKTFSEIGELCGLTRERIRQIEIKYLRGATLLSHRGVPHLWEKGTKYLAEENGLDQELVKYHILSVFRSR
ncbi:hypothetical protein LCGC14_1695590 [marine sediment metagenome]|uniref:RNA polymerase sigma-70 region 4 domain-containing protein n=1 Tax=marine sediment metagenome TaxID=412755 RepID=A0A0F9KJI1_9ZZZZ